MTAQPDSFDISPFPELRQAVEAARVSGRRLRLIERGEAVAELVPAATDVESAADLTEHVAVANEPTAGPAGTPRARRGNGRLKADDALFDLVGIGDSGIEGGVSGRKHEALGKLRHT